MFLLSISGVSTPTHHSPLPLLTPVHFFSLSIQFSTHFTPTSLLYTHSSPLHSTSTSPIPLCIFTLQASSRHQNANSLSCACLFLLLFPFFRPPIVSKQLMILYECIVMCNESSVTPTSSQFCCVFLFPHPQNSYAGGHFFISRRTFYVMKEIGRFCCVSLPCSY